MPNIKSVAKDVIRSRQRHLRNVAAKSAIKTYVKKSKAVIADPNADQKIVGETVAKTFSIIDKAWKHGIIHKNAANRRKSRIAKRLNAAQSA